MKQYLEKKYLEKIFQADFNSFKTGTDKITKDKFRSIREEEYSIIKRKCLNTTYELSRLKKYSKNGRVYHVPTIRDRILIKLLRTILEKKLNINYPNREAIINLIIQKLKTHQDRYIVRLDIKDFFHSIPHNFLLQKIKKNYRVSTIEYYLINEFLKLVDTKGVPIGISLSSTLSEAYLESLDFNLKNIHPQISCYFRYVDDIFIVINGNLDKTESTSLKSKIIEAIRNEGLTINKSKYECCNLHFTKNKQTSFSYLGYLFRVNNKKLHVNISDNKLEKIKGRIKFTFHDYNRNNNIELFWDRLAYLTKRNTMQKVNFRLTSGLGLKKEYNLVYHGIIETYKYADHSVFRGLDKYLQGNFYTFFKQKIDKNDKFKNDLFRHSFQKSLDFGLTNQLHLKDNEFFANRLKNFSDRKEKELVKLNRNELENLYRKNLSL